MIKNDSIYVINEQQMKHKIDLELLNGKRHIVFCGKPESIEEYPIPDDVLIISFLVADVNAYVNEVPEVVYIKRLVKCPLFMMCEIAKLHMQCRPRIRFHFLNLTHRSIEMALNIMSGRNRRCEVHEHMHVGWYINNKIHKNYTDTRFDRMLDHMISILPNTISSSDELYELVNMHYPHPAQYASLSTSILIKYVRICKDVPNINAIVEIAREFMRRVKNIYPSMSIIEAYMQPFRDDILAVYGTFIAMLGVHAMYQRRAIHLLNV